MKKITILSFVLSFFIGFSQEAKKPKLFGKEISSEKISPTGHIRCATDEYEAMLQSKDPKRMTREQFEMNLASIIQHYEELSQVASQSGGIIYIPVVVHVIHNGDAYGVNENITDEQVQSQITVMNQDYRRMLGTPGYNTTLVGADIQIEFVLAKADPNGNPTNGINRVNMCQDYWEADPIDEILKPATIWDPTLYMNMWSVKFGGSASDLLGYAQFPSNGTATANTDGVVAGYSYFGSSALASGSFSAPYDRGRTMTHEVGHFLGLYHTFQGGCPAVEGNNEGDFCADTPAVASPNGGCPIGMNSCSTGGNDMIQNYMDYTDDTCMNIFTQNQKSRIVAVMNTYPRRLDLKNSTKDIAITLFANDAEVIIENSCSNVVATCANPTPAIPNKVISLYNRGTSTLTSAVISYNMDGGTAYTYNYSGNLAPNKFAYITLPNTNVNGTLNTSVTSVNGATDQRTTNNTASKTFTGGSTTVGDYPYTTFTFNLIGDPWGSEITWTLKNSGGTTLYSGGPYTDLSTAGTQNLVTNQTWTLNTYDCYTFTINDSYGDGLAGSTSGGVSNGDTGSWTITANSGAVSVGTGGGNFGSTTSNSFKNTALSSTSFGLDAISMYPNPATDVLNISIPSELGKSISYKVYNNLGQVVKSNMANQNEFSVNTSDLSSGVYFVNLSVDGSSKTLRFVRK